MFRHIPIVSTALLGSAVSVGAFLLAASSERQVVEIEFQRQAEAQLSIINSDLEDAASVLGTLRAYYESDENPIGYGAFVRISGILRRLSAGLRDVGWAPRVEAADRSSFEHAARTSVSPGFEIRERDTSGRLVRAREQSEHYPILYVSPASSAGTVRGIDLTTEPVRRAALEAAIATDRAAATPAIPLLTAPRPKGGVMSFVPVFGRADAQREPGARPAGVLFGVFEIAPMVDSIISARRRVADLDIYIFDPEGRIGERWIYWRPGRTQPDGMPSEESLRGLPHWESRLSIFDREWGVLLLPAHGLDTRLWTTRTLGPLAIGLLLTAMIVAYLIASLRGTLRLQALTTSLRATNVALEQQADTILHLASHDPLTGLPNRRMFSEVLGREVYRASRGKAGCAVLLIDLDHFKPVNDTHGHAAGDAVLCEVARRLRAVTRKGDTVARLGGDEFAAIVELRHPDDELAELAERAIAALSSPIDAGDVTVQIGASIGIAVCPADASDPDTLVRHADSAMYAVKRAQRGWYRFFRAGVAGEASPDAAGSNSEALPLKPAAITDRTREDAG